MEDSLPARPRPLSPGERLGRHEILGLLAVGGMAELHLARLVRAQGFEKAVVLKRILPQYADDPEFVAMFLDEARLAGAMHHPNVVQVYDVDSAHGTPFFTMEYVHGETLSAIVRAAARQRRGLTLGNALTIVTHVAAGLHYAHDRCDLRGHPLETVHRDVSPSNIMVTYDGSVKIVDFGVARAALQRNTTQAGVVKGKYLYMSPEQCMALDLDRRSDVYAIGILLFELTTGTRLYRDKEPTAIAVQLLTETIPRPTERREGYPPELERIVMRALAADRENRYPTARDLQRDLEELALELKISLSTVALGEVMRELFPGRADQPLPIHAGALEAGDPTRIGQGTPEDARTLASLTRAAEADKRSSRVRWAMGASLVALAAGGAFLATRPPSESGSTSAESAAPGVAAGAAAARTEAASDDQEVARPVEERPASRGPTEAGGRSVSGADDRRDNAPSSPPSAAAPAGSARRPASLPLRLPAGSAKPPATSRTEARADTAPKIGGAPNTSPPDLDGLLPE